MTKRYKCADCNAEYDTIPHYEREMGGYSLLVPCCEKCQCDLIYRTKDKSLVQPQQSGW